MAELALSQTLGQLMGNQAAAPQEGLAKNVTQGVQAGVQLATAAEQVEQQKVQLEQQKTDLNDKQFNSMNSMLSNLARANPTIAKKMLPQIQQRFQQMGLDPSIPEVMASDDEYKRRYINLFKGWGPNASSEEKAASLQAAQQLGTFDKGFSTLEQESKLATQLEVQKGKTELANKMLEGRMGQSNARTQLSANREYDAQMKTAENGLVAASRAEDIISQVADGKLQMNKTLRADLTSTMATLVSAGRPSTVYGQSHQEFDSSYQRAKDALNFLSGDAKNTLPPKQFKQLSVDISALKDLYATQHQHQYESLRAGMPDQTVEKLDSRFNTMRKKYKLSGLGDEAPASLPPAAPPDALRMKAQALVGKVTNPKTGKPYTQQEVDERLGK